MKKTLVLFLTLVMVLTLSVPALAAGDFIGSPSAKPGPELVDSSNENEDCEAEVVITPYSEREKLDEDVRKGLEDAYDDIANETDDWKEIIGKLAEAQGVDPEDLAVIDLFDLSYADCDDHDAHGKFTITVSVDDLDNFAGLLQYVDGEWQNVLGATAEGKKVKFTVSELSPMAVVVNTGAVKSPATSDSGMLFGAMMLASAVAAACFMTPAFGKKSR